MQKIVLRRRPHSDTRTQLQKEWLVGQTGRGQWSGQRFNRRRRVSCAGANVDGAPIDLAEYADIQLFVEGPDHVAAENVLRHAEERASPSCGPWAFTKERKFVERDGLRVHIERRLFFVDRKVLWPRVLRAEDRLGFLQV